MMGSPVLTWPYFYMANFLLFSFFPSIAVLAVLLSTMIRCWSICTLPLLTSFLYLWWKNFPCTRRSYSREVSSINTSPTTKCRSSEYHSAQRSPCCLIVKCICSSYSVVLLLVLCIICGQMEPLLAETNRQNLLPKSLPLSSSQHKTRSGPRCLIEQLSDLSNVVKIKYGTVQGVTIRLDRLDLVSPSSNSQSSNGTTGSEYSSGRRGNGDDDGRRLSPIEAYLGVPYASPPTGALRFMPPVTPAHWRGIRPANQLAPLCPQRIAHSTLVMRNTSEALRRMPQARFEWLRRMIPRARNQSEDCLYLNIYTPAIDLSALSRSNHHNHHSQQPQSTHSDTHYSPHSQHSPSTSFPQDSRKKRRRKRNNNNNNSNDENERKPHANIIMNSFNLLFNLKSTLSKLPTTSSISDNKRNLPSVSSEPVPTRVHDENQEEEEEEEVEDEEEIDGVELDDLQSGHGVMAPITATHITNSTNCDNNKSSNLCQNIIAFVTKDSIYSKNNSNNTSTSPSSSDIVQLKPKLKTKKSKSRLQLKSKKSTENSEFSSSSSTIPLNLLNHKKNILKKQKNRNKENSSSSSSTSFSSSLPSHVNSNYSEFRSGYSSSSISSASFHNQNQEQSKHFQESNIIKEPNQQDDSDDDGIYVESYNDNFDSDNLQGYQNDDNAEYQNSFGSSNQEFYRQHHHHHRHRSVPNPPPNPTSATPSTSSSSSTKSTSTIPKSKSDFNFPVLVLITGESYDWNLGSLFDPSLLASFGQTVVVTLNFRLGILGFLPANVDGAMRGNYGLMDQVAALHWIQENIAEFGGSPSNVTIIGHGYGAACAHLLMLSPMAKGLFNRVILMSGSSLSPWAIARDASVYAREVGKQLDCPLNDNTIMVECLRSKTVEQLLSVNFQVPDYLTAFGPIIDGIVVPSEPRKMLRETPPLRPSYNSNSNKRTSNSPNFVSSSSPSSSSTSSSSSSGPSTGHFIHHRLHHHSPSSGGNTFLQSQPDLMVGVTRVESLPIFSSYEERNGISVTRRDQILRTLVRNSFDYHQQAIFYTLINEYTDWTRSAEHPIRLIDSLIELLGDALVVAPLVESLDHQYISSSNNNINIQSNSGATSQHSGSLGPINLDSRGPRSTNSRAFFYVFSHQEQSLKSMDDSKTKGARLHDRLGASHSEELAYLFGLPLLGSLRTSLISNHNFLKCDNRGGNGASASDEVNNEDNYEDEEEDEEEELDDDELDYLEYSPISNRNINRLLRYPTLDISPTNHDHFDTYSSTTTINQQRQQNHQSSTFNKLPRQQFNYSQSDVNLSKLIISYWIHFASYGDPNIFWRQSASTTSSGNHHSSGSGGSSSRGHYRSGDYYDDPNDDEDSRQDSEMSGNKIPEKGSADLTQDGSSSSHARRFHHRSQRLESTNGDYGEDSYSSSINGGAEIVASGNQYSYREYHLSQLSLYGYQHLGNCRLDSSVMWPSYDTLQKKYLHFGSKVKVRDHYHSHRLSIWLSLIPRLHIPIELSNQNAETPDKENSDLGDAESTGGKSDLVPDLDPEQYFYLRHHLLPDHENFATYDGVVKQLTIRVPGSRQWQQKFIRPNQSMNYLNSYEQLYGRLLATSGGGGGQSGSIKHQPAGLNSFTANGKPVSVHSEIAGRRIDQKNPNGGGGGGDGSLFGVNSGNNGNHGSNGDSDSVANNNNNNNNEDGNQLMDSDLEFYDVSTTSTTSVLHYEAQTSDLYSTALLVTIVVGCSLLILNLLIFIGVYYQLDHKKDGESAAAATAGAPGGGGGGGGDEEIEDSGSTIGETHSTLSRVNIADEVDDDEQKQSSTNYVQMAISTPTTGTGKSRQKFQQQQQQQSKSNFMETSDMIISNNNSGVYGNTKSNNYCQSSPNNTRTSPGKQHSLSSSNSTNSGAANLNYHQNSDTNSGGFCTLNKPLREFSNHDPYRSPNSSSKYKTLPMRPNCGQPRSFVAQCHQSSTSATSPGTTQRSQRRRSSPRTSTYHHFYSPEHTNNLSTLTKKTQQQQTAALIQQQQQQQQPGPILTPGDQSNIELYFTAASGAAANCNQCNESNSNIISIEPHSDNSYYIYQPQPENGGTITDQQYTDSNYQSNQQPNSTNSNSSTPLKSILKNSHHNLRSATNWDPSAVIGTSALDPSSAGTATILNVYSTTTSIPRSNQLGPVQFISCSSDGSPLPSSVAASSGDQSSGAEFISFISTPTSEAKTSIDGVSCGSYPHHPNNSNNNNDNNNPGSASMFHDPSGGSSGLIMPYYTLTELYPGPNSLTNQNSSNEISMENLITKNN